MKDQKKRTGILICGAYGLGNVGDEAILSAILHEMREVAPDAEITVLSRKPKETERVHGVRAVHMFDLPGVWRAMRGAGLYINGGGTLIQDVTSRRSLWYYLYTLKAAKRRGCRVLMYGCGIGPVRDKRDVALARRVLSGSVDAITLREPDSWEELKKMGVEGPRARLTADPALTLEKASQEAVDQVLKRAGIPPEGAYIAFALRNWEGFEEKAGCFAQAARYAYETYHLTAVFTAVEKHQDPAAGRLAAKGLDTPHYFLDDGGEVNTLIGVLSRMRMVVSMRLHALIFAAGQGVPLVGVVYDPKVSSFLAYIGQDLYLDLENVTAQALMDCVDKAAARMGDRERLLAEVARLRMVESGNSETARRLLKGEGA